MFKRKLKALDYVYWDRVNAHDEQHFRKLVVWLEDQNIRHYTIQDRTDLRAIEKNTWDKVFDKYIQDLGCPVTTSNLDKLEWLIGLAVRLEFEDNLPKYQVEKENEMDVDEIPIMKSTNPLDNLNFQDDEFKNGVKSIAKLLQIPQHIDHLVTLEACSKFITQRLHPAAVKNPKNYIIEGEPTRIMENSTKCQVKDKMMNETVAALDLLYIQDLRNLQTSINEATVTVQNITANPKTDTTAGRLGS